MKSVANNTTKYFKKSCEDFVCAVNEKFGREKSLWWDDN